MARQTRLIDKKPAFLAAFRVLANVREAAKAAKIDRSLHYDWLDSDPEYAAAFARARREAGQELKDDAVEWARKGIFEPLVYQGQFQFAQREVKLHTLPDGREVRDEQLPDDRAGVEIVSTRTITEPYGPPLGIYRRSESLLARLLKAFIPEEFGDKTEITGPGGGAIESALTVTFVRPEDK